MRFKGNRTRHDELFEMPIPIDVNSAHVFSGTARRIYQLLTEMGTSADAIWPFAAQPFLRTAGPLAVGSTEEWHLGLHAVLSEAVPDDRIVWRFDSEDILGSHGFYLAQSGKKTTVRHRLIAELSEPQGKMLWKRLEDTHERAIDGLFDKLARVLKR